MKGHGQDSANAVSAGIERMPFSLWHVRLLALLGTANLFDALDATAIAFVLPSLVDEWTLSATQIGFLIAGGYAGQMVGAVLGGVLAERYGRIPTMRLNLYVMSLFSFACAFAPSYSILMVLRILQGIGLGGQVPIAATYLNEVCPPRFRGKMVNAIQLMFATGALSASLLAVFLIPRFGWQSMFIVGGMPIVLALTLHRLLPESPRWLLENRSREAARAALTEIEKCVGVTSAEAEPAGVTSEIKLPATSVEASAGVRQLFGRSLLGPTLSAWIIAFCSSLVAYGLLGWMPSVYRTVYQLSLEASLNLGLANGVGAFAGVAAGILLIDRLGRKKCLALGFLGASIAIIVLWLLGKGIEPFYVAVLSAIAIAFVGLPAAVLYVYAPEIYPTKVRALGTGVASAWVRIAAIIGPPVIGVALTIGTIMDVYLLLGSIAAFGAVATVILAVETRPIRETD